MCSANKWNQSRIFSFLCHILTTTTALRRNQHQCAETLHAILLVWLPRHKFVSPPFFQSAWRGNIMLSLFCSVRPSATVNALRHLGSLWGLVSLLYYASDMPQEIKPWSKTKPTVLEETGKHQRAYSRKADVVEVACVCVCVCAVSYSLVNSPHKSRWAHSAVVENRVHSRASGGTACPEVYCCELVMSTSTALIAFCLSAETFPRHLAACLSSLDFPSKSVTYSLHLTPHTVFLSQTLSKQEDPTGSDSSGEPQIAKCYRLIRRRK